MKPTTQAFDDAMLRGESLSRIILFLNGFGLRIWGEEKPIKLAEAEGTPNLADGTYQADGSITANSGLGVSIDISARLLPIASLDTGNADFSLEDFVDQSEGTIVSFQVSNEDGLCSEIEATENILSAIVQLVVISPEAASWADRLVIGQYRVEGFDLDRDILTLECKAF